jgi:hypothetical protein
VQQPIAKESREEKVDRSETALRREFDLTATLLAFFYFLLSTSLLLYLPLANRGERIRTSDLLNPIQKRMHFRYFQRTPKFQCRKQLGNRLSAGIACILSYFSPI